MKLTPFVFEWIRRAEQDYQMVLYILKHPTLAELGCFHAQQFAEKYLKIFLISNHKKFPKTHNLMDLIQLCNDFDTHFDELKKPALLLNNLYIQSRYPSEIYEITLIEVKKAFSAAKIIKKFVMDRLK